MLKKKSKKSYLQISEKEIELSPTISTDRSNNSNLLLGNNCTNVQTEKKSFNYILKK